MNQALLVQLAILLSAQGQGAGAGPEVDNALQTVAERSGYKATARYDDVMALCRRLAETYSRVKLQELGKTGEGRGIPLLIVSDPPVTTPEEAARSGKLVVLLVGNIHAGEVCGKEALPMLARELAANPGNPLLKDMIVAMVPIYNADGNERVSKDNRPGQVGPEEGMGQRANAAGLDLNRDFMKLEAPETRALVRFLNRWDPHLVIDTHTTNGSHHRYTITYQGPKNPAGDRHVIEFTRDTMMPAVASAFEKRTGLHAFLYGNFNRAHDQWSTYPASPRYGTTYIGLRNRVAILSEAYAYAPYETRVKATLDYVRTCLEYASAHKADLDKLLKEARAAQTGSAGNHDPVAIRSKTRALKERKSILGFVEEERDGKRVATDEPKEYTAELLQDFEPTLEVHRPFAYLVPAKFEKVVQTLQRHGLDLEELREDIELRRGSVAHR